MTSPSRTIPVKLDRSCQGRCIRLRVLVTKTTSHVKRSCCLRIIFQPSLTCRRLVKTIPMWFVTGPCAYSTVLRDEGTFTRQGKSYYSFSLRVVLVCQLKEHMRSDRANGYSLSSTTVTSRLWSEVVSFGEGLEAKPSYSRIFFKACYDHRH